MSIILNTKVDVTMPKSPLLGSTPCTSASPTLSIPSSEELDIQISPNEDIEHKHSDITAKVLRLSNKYQHKIDQSTDRDIAFTILEDDDVELNDKNITENGDEGIGSTEEIFKTRKLNSELSSSFGSSPEDQKILTNSNSSVLKEKLMNLNKSQKSLQDEKLYKKNLNFERVNNLTHERVYSISNNNLNQTKTEYNLKKDFSQSYTNLNKTETKKYPQPHRQPPNKNPRVKRHLENPTMSYTNKIKSDNRNLNNDKINNNNNKCKQEQKRPIFMSTVKQGSFLEPPPEIAYLLGLGSMATSCIGSNNSLNSSRDRHQHQVMLYSFSSQPRVVHQARHRAKSDVRDKSDVRPKPQGRAKREVKDVEDDVIPYGNLMFDRRVVRGSTIAQPIPTQEEAQAARQQEAKRRALARRRAQHRSNKMATTPPPVCGRRHEHIQTDKRLEELFDHPSEREIGCQTERYVARPESPSYVAAKQAVEVGTQVYPGELFDFDLEARPVVEDLAGRTLEEALMEVMEEDELAALQEKQRRLLELREAEKAEEERLKRGEKRISRTKRQESPAPSPPQDRAATVVTAGYLTDALPAVLEGLKEAGYGLDEIKADTEGEFMPWLVGEVSNEMTHMVNNKDILTDIVREILETRAEIYRVMSEEEEKNLHLGTSDEDEGNR